MKGEDGALSQVYAATYSKVNPSETDYIGPRYVIFGKPTVQKTDVRSWDDLAQRNLWEVSVKLTGTDLNGI